MEKLFIEDEEFREHIRQKAQTLIVFSTEYLKELDNENDLYSSLYQESIEDLLSDLSAHVYNGHTELEYVEQELEKRNINLSSILLHKIDDDEMSL